MRKFSPVVFVMLITFSMACHKSTENFKLAIDVQSSFEGDHVQVLIDNVKRINDHLQTNHTISFCPDGGHTEFGVSKSSHRIEVIINDRLKKSEIFEVKNDLYIGVNFHREEDTIRIVYSPVRFMYD